MNSRNKYQVPPVSSNLARYQLRMQRVIDHINANLDSDLDPDPLAEAACLSRYHWHHIYRGITGETIHTNRLSRLTSYGTSPSHP